jgi:hypothetical protein
MCQFYLKGRCLRGEECKFAHHKDELHVPGERLHGRDKRKYERGKLPPTSKPASSHGMDKEEEPNFESEAVSKASSREEEQSPAHSATPAASESDVPEPKSRCGDMDGNAICVGKWTASGPRVWIGTAEDAARSKFLHERKITVVVRCKHGYANSAVECSHGIAWVNGSCWDSAPDEFPFTEQNGIPGEDIFCWALVNMCKQINLSLADGNVLFYCRAGRNRSFAAAMAYVMWEARGMTFDAARVRMMEIHERFKVSDYVQTIKGRVRRGLAMDLRNWERYLARYTPPSGLQEIPVIFSKPRSR